MRNQCATARSFLFVPGNRPERFEKAAQSGADAIILDLEDSVPGPEKKVARIEIENHWERLSQFGVPVVIRTNAVESSDGILDLQVLKRLRSVTAVMLPKAASADAIVAVHEEIGGAAILPIIESAAGFMSVHSVAAAKGVLRLAVGHIDFMADTGLQCDENESELLPLRFAVSMATCLNGLASAIDGVTIQIGDESRLRADTRRAMRFGFGGKLCIHPKQVSMVHQALAPTEQELIWAHRVLKADEASAGAAVQLDGKMIDLPVVLQAKRTLARVQSQ